jgi:tRNA(adenine34) deaminase
VESYIRTCIKLAEQSISSGEAPFGSLIVRNDQIIAKATNANRAENDVSRHAEIMAMRIAQAKLGRDLSDCEIYSNCEPCPMCSLMIRELGIKKVVFGVKSPHMGGHSRWNILGDAILSKFLGHKPPQVISGVLASECLKTFRSVGWGDFLEQLFPFGSTGRL